ncbi:hypothetical protein LTR84_010746 [Exophiala bonariae]|uniref:Enoyl reductase (ER) domain-containing protein n=1 Tax=Exophiala bonariae TaxID=1690606 RepID=A0AAV9MUW9_9EURO|nr:hypothetical protein LTR84_010746 [Exophiala bonariae]
MGKNGEFTIPKFCKAGVMYDEGPGCYVKVEDVPVPEPGPDELLLRLNITGLCFSDLHYMMNDLALPKMSDFGVRSPGHEGAGVVVKLGGNVKGWSVGDRGGVKPLWDTCGSCRLCWGGQETHCRKGVFTGLQCPGTYQQYILSPAKYTTRIPEGVSDELAAEPIMCSASTMVQSLEASGLRPGNWAVFPGGGGGVGIQGIQLAAAMGFRPIAIDTGPAKRELCLRLGAEAFVDFKETTDVTQRVIEITDGEGAHGVFVTAPQAYANAISYTGSRPGSCVMCIGLPASDTVILGADPAKYVLQNFSISGTVVGSMMDTEKALDFARRGKLEPIYETFSIDKLPEALAKLKAGQVAGRVVIDFNQ